MVEIVLETSLACAEFFGGRFSGPIHGKSLEMTVRKIFNIISRQSFVLINEWEKLILSQTNTSPNSNVFS
jgi:hypothetical protein